MSVCIWTCFFLSVRGYFNSYFQPQDVTFFGLLGALLPDLHRGSICPWTPPGDFRPQTSYQCPSQTKILDPPLLINLLLLLVVLCACQSKADCLCSIVDLQHCPRCSSIHVVNGYD